MRIFSHSIKQAAIIALFFLLFLQGKITIIPFDQAYLPDIILINSFPDFGFVKVSGCDLGLSKKIDCH